MRLQVHHQTEYLYSKAVTNSSNQLRLTPTNTATQQCQSSYVGVLPASRLTHYEDLNGNRVHRFEITRPHQRLAISSQAIVDTQLPIDFGNLPYGISTQKLSQCNGLAFCHQYLLDSTFVELSPEAWRQGIDIQNQGEDVFQICFAIMQSIFESYEYNPQATNVRTHANEVLNKKAGVCQDFAHAMLAICRAIQIPARYISGYFFDTTRDHSLRGSSASHAWVETYIPNYGWIGLDPTNNKLVDDTYIQLAIGRDYRDVAPVMGTYDGGASSALSVKIQVEKLSV